MLFHFPLVSSLLLASAALANDQQEFSGGAHVEGSDDNAFSTVATSVNIPKLFGSIHDSITVAVSLKSEGCLTYARSGFDCIIGTSNQTLCMGWSMINHNEVVFPDLSFGPGDIVNIGITSPYHHENDPTEYTRTWIENVSTSQSRTNTLEGTVCRREAKWALFNTPTEDGSYWDIARFGELDFTTTRAFTPVGSFLGPTQEWDMTAQDRLVAIVSSSEYSMVIADARELEG